MEFRPDICQVWVSCSDDFVGFGVEILPCLAEQLASDAGGSPPSSQPCVTLIYNTECFAKQSYTLQNFTLSRCQIFVNAPHYVGMVLLVVVPDHTVNILLLYHSVVVDQSPQNLHIMEIPYSSILAVEDIVVDHGAEPLLVLVSDGDLVVLVQHEAKVPVAAGS